MVAGMFNACNKGSKNFHEQVLEFNSSLSESDTTQMLDLCDRCMEYLKSNQVESALGMLYEYDDEDQSVAPLSEETLNSFRHRFSVFPVIDYNRISYTFLLEGLNDVKYEIIFAEEEHPEINGVPKTYFMFNPVKVDGQWYLCVKRSDQGFSY